MRNESIRNPKVRSLSTPSRTVVIVLLLAAAAGVGYCGSSKKGVSVTATVPGVRESGTAVRARQVVQVTSHPGDVRGCSFMARVPGPSGEEGSLNAGALRGRAADAGGNVLLLLPNGNGEAWHCEQRTRADAASFRTGSAPVPGW